jgi:hypothetical protein
MGNREWGMGNWKEGNYPFPIIEERAIAPE